MSKWNLVVDVAKCENCYNCFVACKDEHVGNDFPGYAAPQPLHGHQWIDLQRHERGRHPIVEANFMPVMCNHCDDAPCLAAAEHGAVTKRDDGIVIIDPVKARGQRQIVDACPYGAAWWNEELQLPQIWIFDAHLLDGGWTRTRAEQVCGPGALRSLKVDDDEMRRIAAAEGLEVLQPELGTRPRVYYKNLHLMTRCFVAGTVLAEADGVADCLAGATATLLRAGAPVGTATSDVFGEFKIDGLEAESGTYTLRLETDGRAAVEVAVELGTSQVVGPVTV